MAEELNFEGKILLKRWEILRKIGGGSFGSVFMSWDQQTKSMVAIKFEESSESEKLQNEAQILNKLRNNNKFFLGIPQIYWIGQDP